MAIDFFSLLLSLSFSGGYISVSASFVKHAFISCFMSQLNHMEEDAQPLFYTTIHLHFKKKGSTDILLNVSFCVISHDGEKTVPGILQLHVKKGRG